MNNILSNAHSYIEQNEKFLLVSFFCVHFSALLRYALNKIENCSEKLRNTLLLKPILHSMGGNYHSFKFATILSDIVES